MVAQEPELVGGGEGEEVTVHVAGCQTVAAGELLDLDLVEPGVLTDLAGDDEPGALEASDLGGVLDAGLHEEVAGRGLAVVGEEPLEDFCEDGLAVGSGAVEEGEDLGGDAAGGCVACEELEVVGHAGVPSEGLLEELVPAGCGAVRVWGDQRAARVELGGV